MLHKPIPVLLSRGHKVVMKTNRVTARLCVFVVLIITRTTGSVCYTALESLDLSCLLRWDCPLASPNVTYTVQTKIQEDPWQDVPWCIWISTRSCDVSQVFSNFKLYNMIRLGVHLGSGSTVWTKPHKFDYSDFTFSPPSVSVSWKDDCLLVEVKFPCAADRKCSHDGCCPISKLINPWTTVTVYNELNLSKNQSRTVWTQEDVSHVEFSGLSPYQNYCAVANFSFPTFSMAASPKSFPQCVQTVSSSEMLPIIYYGIVLVSLFLVLLLLVILQKPRRPTPRPENPPKTLNDSVSPTLVPVDPSDVHLELVDDPIFNDSPSSSRSNQILSPRDCEQQGPASDLDYFDSDG